MYSYPHNLALRLRVNLRRTTPKISSTAYDAVKRYGDLLLDKSFHSHTSISMLNNITIAPLAIPLISSDASYLISVRYLHIRYE